MAQQAARHFGGGTHGFPRKLFREGTATVGDLKILRVVPERSATSDCRTNRFAQTCGAVFAAHPQWADAPRSDKTEHTIGRAVLRHRAGSVSVDGHNREGPSLRRVNSAASQSFKQQGIEGFGGDLNSQNLAIHFDLNGLRVAITIDQDQDGVTA